METLERPLAVRRRNRLAVLAALFAPVTLAILLGIITSSVFGGVALGYLAFYLTPIFVWQAMKKRTRLATVHASRDGLLVDGRAPFGTRTLRSGLFVPGSEPIVALSAGKTRNLEVLVRDQEEGRALLRALGLDPSASRASFTAYSRKLSLKVALTLLGAYVVYSAMLAALAGVIGGTAAVLAWITPLLPVLVLWTTVDMGLWTTFDIGADGVLVRWLGRKRFHAWADVAEVQSGPLTLVLRSGERVELPFLDPQLGEAAAERAREALAAHVPDATAALEPLLARGGRAGAEWLRDVRRLAEPGNATFRAPAVEPERLRRVACDPAAETTARAGAAAALARALDDEGRGRLRVAARACASPRLRVALEAAANEEEEALAAALDQVDAERAEP